jgi:hypothetical protein
MTTNHDFLLHGQPDELTLHIIRLDNQVTRLRSDVNALMAMLKGYPRQMQAVNEDLIDLKCRTYSSSE